ncbi:pentapeptide repeat-containing protein [candidate division KSB1 bacterium]|nr:pentapeptide repeat-containing protein [candidate division KSB1 bacterium]
MKKFRFIIFLLILIYPEFTLQARNKISANTILHQIEAGKAVSYEYFDIIGNLDLTAIQNRSFSRNIKKDSTQKIVINQLKVPLTFQNCVFKGGVSGYYHNYQQNTVFCTRFQKSIIFKNCEFQGESSFLDAQFQEKVDFTGSEFKTEALFKNAEFKNEVCFQDVHFRGDANFRSVVFKKVASFMGAYFEEEAEFRYAKFQRGGNFYSALFMSKALFKSSEFRKIAFFKEAQFKRDFDFQDAKFDGKEFKP